MLLLLCSFLHALYMITQTVTIQLMKKPRPRMTLEIFDRSGDNVTAFVSEYPMAMTKC